MKNLITVLQAARLLKISEVRIRQLCVTGQIKAQKMGRDWLVNLKSVNQRIKAGPKPGRPAKK